MNIVIAGGGTGGHIFPGVSTALAFQRKVPENSVVFIGTDRGIESRVVPGAGFRLEKIRIFGFKGKGLIKKMVSLMSVPYAFIQAYLLLKRLNPAVVLGLGGYIAFPVILASVLMKRPCGIHEQNSFPGLANRLLGRIADRVFITFEDSGKFFPAGKTVLTGLPVRQTETPTSYPGVPGDRFCVFVIGGSQGARQINTAVLESLDFLEDIKHDLFFIHQTGDADVERVARTCIEKGWDNAVHGFIDDVFSCFKVCDLVVSRAGASTLAETALWEKPSVLIPYPFAANNHQFLNARAFADKGASEIIPSKQLSGQYLAGCIRGLMTEKQRLKQMASAAAGLAMPSAAETIVNECYKLAGGKNV